MPLVSVLLGALLTACSSLVGRVLLALGLSFVVFKGYDVSVSWLLNQIKSNIGSMPSDVLSFLAWLWVDKAIGLLFSSYAAAAAIQFGTGGTITKLVRK